MMVHSSNPNTIDRSWSPTFDRDQLRLDLDPGEILEVTTETKHVDLWVRVRRRGGRVISVVVENKLKSAEHSDQLSTYDGHLEVGDLRLFLTLISERPRANADWQPLHYGVLHGRA